MSVGLYTFVIPVLWADVGLHATVADTCTDEKMLFKCLRWLMQRLYLWRMLDSVLVLLVTSCGCLAGTLQMCWSVSRGEKLG